MSSKTLVLLLLLVSWAPITGPAQILAYAGPTGLALLALLSGSVRISRFDGFWLFGLGSLGFASAAFYGETGVLHPAVGLLTYSPLLILAVRFPRSGPSGDLGSTVRFFFVATAIVSLFEAALGVVQLVVAQGGLAFATLSAGDAVVGTLGTNSHLFAVKMLFQGFLLALAWHQQRSLRGGIGVSPALLLLGAVAAFVGALLASALLSTVSFLSAVAVWTVWRVLKASAGDLVRYGGFRRRILRAQGGLLGAAAAALLLVGVFAAIQPGNALLIGRTLGRVVTGEIGLENFQKFAVLEESITEVMLADAGNTVYGMGLGRYSSRAAMILSGGYLTRHPDWIPVSRSNETTERIYARWNPRTWRTFFGSIMGMPTSSAQAVLVELGLLGTLVVLGYGFSLVVRAGRKLEGASPPASVLVGAVPGIVLAFAAISVTDLWLEYGSLTAFVAVAMALGLSTPAAMSVGPGGGSAHAS